MIIKVTILTTGFGILRFGRSFLYTLCTSTNRRQQPFASDYRDRHPLSLFPFSSMVDVCEGPDYQSGVVDVDGRAQILFLLRVGLTHSRTVLRQEATVSQLSGDVFN